MAEAAFYTYTLDDITNCHACKQTLKKPIRLGCLHYFCKKCLDEQPKEICEHQAGWSCMSCGSFTRQTDIKPNELLESLITMETEKLKVDFCQFCEKEKNELMYCKECKMLICDNCKTIHTKTPPTKNHPIETIDVVDQGVIDEIYFCSKHDDELLDTYCNKCQEMMCKTCLKAHKNHAIQTPDDVLNDINIEMENFTKNINVNIRIGGQQMEALKNEMKLLRESYANWRKTTSEKLEKLIGKLRTANAILDESVIVKEEENIKRLENIRIGIHNKVEKLKIVSNMANLVKHRTKNHSQLRELQGGLYEWAKVLGKDEMKGHHITLTTPYIQDNMYDYTQDKIKEIIKEADFETSIKVVEKSGEAVKKEECICRDFNQYLKQKFEKIDTIKLDMASWCNRLNTVRKSMFVALPNENTIQEYNTSLKCVNTYSDTHKSIVVKQANSGDVLCAGDEGLFITNSTFERWDRIHDGMFCDIAIHGKRLSSLNYKTFQVYTFENNNNQWKLHSYFAIQSQHREYIAKHNSTLIVDHDNNVIINNSFDKLLVYSLSGKYLKSFKLSGMLLLGAASRITGMDAAGNVLLCDFRDGKLYSINNILGLNPDYMANYLVCEKDKNTRDLAIDCDGNLWILHGQRAKYFITKYVPKK